MSVVIKLTRDRDRCADGTTFPASHLLNVCVNGLADFVVVVVVLVVVVVVVVVVVFRAWDW